MSKLTQAIDTLQTALRETYGDGMDTESGACTLAVAHDRIELTDADGEIVADTAEEAAEELGARTPAPARRQSFARRAE